MAFLLFSGVAEAKECYTSIQNPSWTIIIDQGADPEWVWRQGDKTVELTTGSAGTGIPVRVANDLATQKSYSYLLHDGDLIVEMDVYEPVSCD